MYRAEVLSSWLPIGDDDDSNRPTLGRDYACTVSDATGQQEPIPDPNMYVVQVECDEATLDAIEADPIYYVLWSEEIIDEII